LFETVVIQGSSGCCKCSIPTVFFFFKIEEKILSEFIARLLEESDVYDG
jgi:hypothetical protein